MKGIVMIHGAGGQHSGTRSLTGLVVYVAIALTATMTLFGSTAQALEVPLVEPIDTTAPTASITLAAPTVETGKTIVVSFNEPVVAAQAEDLQNYSVVSPQPSLSYDNLVGHAAAVYDPDTMQATITLIDDSWLLRGEGLVWGVRGIDDLAGNTINPTTYSGVEMVAPTAPGSLMVTSALNDRMITWAWLASIDEGEYPSGIASYGYTLTKNGLVVDSGVLAADVLTLNTEVVDDGTYMLTIWAVDAAGNTSEVTTAEMTIDATPPAITIDGSTMTGNKAQPVIGGESEGLTYSWTTASPSNSVMIAGADTRIPTITVLRDGTYVYALTVTDTAGNVTVKYFTVSYAFPFVPPVDESELVVELVPYIIPPARTVTTFTRDRMARNDTVSQSSGAADMVSAPTVSDSSAKAAPGSDLETLESQAAMNGVIFMPTTQGWRILGILWYWWVAAGLVVFAGWKWLRFVRDTKN